jgi:hypothetical protein
MGPDEQAMSASSERDVGVVGLDGVGQQRERAVVELHVDALERAFSAGVISSSCRMPRGCRGRASRSPLAMRKSRL